MNNYIEISGRKIGYNQKPYIIAEMSANHNGDIESAFSIIRMAKECGADAVKLQTYTPDTITLDSDEPEFVIRGGLWGGRTLYQLYEEAHTPWEWHRDLFKYAHDLGICIFSSPFDESAVDLLEDLGAPAYKIASFEAVDIKLIKYAASTGKPLIISTGMADFEEIEEAIIAAKDAGCNQLALLHCVSGYPAPPNDYNLKTIVDMRRKLGLVTGLSDHTLSNTTAIASIALGASIIEKHVTLDRNGGGPDDSFSLDSSGLKELCKETETAWTAVGCVDYGRKSSEIGNIQFRRSLYFVKPMKAGDVIAHDDIRSVRPGYGVAPKYFDDIVGKKVLIDISENTAVSFDVIG